MAHVGADWTESFLERLPTGSEIRQCMTGNGCVGNFGVDVSLRRRGRGR